MNNSYPNYPGSTAPYQGTMPPYQNFTTTPALTPQIEYAENLLKFNRGKYAEFYMSYADSLEWKDRVFKGIIEDSGRDYSVVKQTDGSYALLWNVYLNYVIFPEGMNIK